MTNEKTIYELELNEFQSSGCWDILRVPGGWIYTYFNQNTQTQTHSVFVPFHNEFMMTKDVPQYPEFQD